MMTSKIAATRTVVNAGSRHCRPPLHRSTIDQYLPISSVLHSSSSRTSSSISENIAAARDDDDTPTTRNPHYPLMFEPLYLGPHIGYLPNRVIMGSMHTGLEGHSMPKLLLSALDAEEPDGHDDLTRMARYFEERAKGGVGLMGENETTDE